MASSLRIVTQPSFVPVTTAQEVRPSLATSTPELGRSPKAGLQRSVPKGRGLGTPGPDGGFALSLVAKALHDFNLDPSENHHDVEAALAALVSVRAGAAGRGPCRSDVEAIADLFGYRTTASADVVARRRRLMAGVGHSYFRLRAFVDAVASEATQAPEPADAELS